MQAQPPPRSCGKLHRKIICRILKPGFLPGRLSSFSRSRWTAVWREPSNSKKALQRGSLHRNENSMTNIKAAVRTVLFCSISVICLRNADAQQVSFTNSYTQNFDTLANSGTSAVWTNNSTITGWYARNFDGAGANYSTYTPSTGNSGTGALYSFGAASNTDRALGSVGSGSSAPGYALRLVNTSGSTINDLKISYTGEQWRQGDSSNTSDGLSFDYKIATLGAAAITDTTGYTAVSGLGFSVPLVGSGSGAAVDGNANSVAISADLTGLNWGNNQEIWLRWKDVNSAGADAGPSIDNVSVVVIPEPSSLAFLGLSFLPGAAFLRRRK